MKMVPSLAGPIRQPSFQKAARAEPVEIWKARKFIHEHSDEKLGLTKVAKSVHVSPNYLSERFKEVTGVNFVDYIACIRTGKARERLQEFRSADYRNRVCGRLSVIVAVQ